MEFKLGLENQKPFGDHGRAMIYGNAPDYQKIISAEVSGDYIARLAAQEEQGRLLIMGKLHAFTVQHYLTYRLLKSQGPVSYEIA